MIPKGLYEAKKLRTLLLLSPRSDFREAPKNIFSSFPYLRVLSLSGCGIELLPASIRHLTCLRYLDLSYTFIKRLPEDLCDLFQLQNLNLLGCCNITALPRMMRIMTQLRHLNIKGCKSLTWMPARIGDLIELQTLPIFIVGQDAERSLEELQLLKLQGELEIKHLENVKNTWEAAEIKLKEKQFIELLGLSWGEDDLDWNVRKENKSESLLFHMMNKISPSVRPSEKKDCNISCGGNVEELLECLQPNTNLKMLLLNGYPGKRFPCWMGNLQLPNLIELVLFDCRKCEHLPGLGQLPLLKTLYMHGMYAVKHIRFEFYGNNPYRPFPSLKELTLIDFPNLEDWLCMVSKEAFPSLVKLTVKKCPKLKTMPWFPSLQCLELQNCNQVILRFASELSSLCSLVVDVVPDLMCLPEQLLGNNPDLKSLTISSCPHLQSLPASLGRLVALKSLVIRWCEELTSFPKELWNLVSLESMEISECHSITSFPEDGVEGLGALRNLSIENCNSLKCLPMVMRSLKALEHLTIMYCPKLASFPVDMQHLTTLRSLNILSCPELTCLPEELQHVTTLQNLEIRSSPGLISLPEWVENLVSLRSLAISDCHNLSYLPEGLQRLSALQHLSIQECPSLEKRCERIRGEDWKKISHIPHIYIGSLGLAQQDIASSSLN
ncbi:hypothetical protein IFM89_010009 [Coptis chinensis]|uniref:Uncharacterized protein n=1 Tax=Coptis chinensis TaxID=261450 RepID=A0A835I2P2_9MAGN|nr:hypothetical protein IFM89_010009 [Coptis chinensis]